MRGMLVLLAFLVFLLELVNSAQAATWTGSHGDEWSVPESVDIIHAGQSHELLPNPVKNTVLMSAGERYERLSHLVNDRYGTFTQDSPIRLMDRPVAMKHNLHNVLMVPEDGIIYVANPDPNSPPAWKQKYYKFNIMQLMSSRPN